MTGLYRSGCGARVEVLSAFGDSHVRRPDFLSASCRGSPDCWKASCGRLVQDVAGVYGEYFRDSFMKG